MPMSARLLGVVGSLTLVLGYASIGAWSDVPEAGGAAGHRDADGAWVGSPAVSAPGGDRGAPATTQRTPSLSATVAAVQSPGGDGAGRVTDDPVSLQDFMIRVYGEPARAHDPAPTRAAAPGPGYSSPNGFIASNDFEPN